MIKKIKRKIEEKREEKKNYSVEHKKYLNRIRGKKFFVLGMQIAIFAAFLGLWQLLTHLEVLDAFMVSSPSRIFKVFKANFVDDAALWGDVGITVLECILGFVIATVLGTVIAILLWWNKTLQRITEPYIIVLNSLPKIALGPIIVMWAGIGMKSIVVMCVLICIVVTVMSVLGGFAACDPNKMLLLDSMGANRFQILTKLMLPYSVPNLIGVLKMNIGLAWVGTIMGEYISTGKGIGYQLQYRGQVWDVDLLMTFIFILCILATAMYLIVSFVEKLFKR